MSDIPSSEDDVLKTDIHIQASYRLTEALVASEKKMRRRIELLSEVVFETDTNGLFRFLNRAWTNVLGYGLESSIGTPLRDFVVDEDRALVVAYLDKTSPPTVQPAVEIRLRCADQSIVSMELSGAPLDEGGMVGTLYNVTQRNNAQAELAKLSMVASFTDSMVVITDADRNIEWANQAFFKRTGYSFEECIGRNPGSFLQGPDTDLTMVAKLREGLDSRQSVQCEILNYTKSGEEYWLSIVVTPIFNVDGKLERFISVQNDITIVRQMQHDLHVAKEAAERASQAKSVFLAAMSHEIRTPLNGVLGMVSLLLDGQLAPEQRQRADIIKNSGEALVTIVNDILDYSKIESGRFSLTSEQFNLHEILRETINLFKGNAETKHVELNGTFIGDEALCVIGDQGRFRQVLMNLVSNAIKFTAQGRVDVEMTQRKRAKGTEVEVRVKDTGIGIAEDDLSRLFVHFSQIDSSATRKAGGTGLGLAISKQLIEMMGGEIGVESRPSEGSTFWFKVSLRAVISAHAIDNHGPKLGEYEFGGLKALIAEDNTVNQMVLKGILDSIGLDADIVENGREALNAVGSGNYDLVLMDVHMPEMDGLEATREIRRTSAIPIVAVTANVLSDQIRVCFESGMNGFVPKPISRQTIETELVRVLTGPVFAR